MPTKQLERYEDRSCKDPEHNPPSMIVLEAGLYEHTCPRCGETQKFEIPLVTL